MTVGFWHTMNWFVKHIQKSRSQCLNVMQVPGQYFLKPFLREFDFAPSSLVSSVVLWRSLLHGVIPWNSRFWTWLKVRTRQLSSRAEEWHSGALYTPSRHVHELVSITAVQGLCQLSIAGILHQLEFRYVGCPIICREVGNLHTHPFSLYLRCGPTPHQTECLFLHTWLNCSGESCT